MKIGLRDFGGFLSSRELGHRIALSILDSMRKDPENNVILDFSGVQSVHRNFCDELLTTVFTGIGFEEFRKRVVVQNQSAVVRVVFDSILSEKKGTPVKGIDEVLGSPIQTVHSESGGVKSVERGEVVSPLLSSETRSEGAEVVEKTQSKPDKVEGDREIEGSTRKMPAIKTGRSLREAGKGVKRSPSKGGTSRRRAADSEVKKERSIKKGSARARRTVAKKTVTGKKRIGPS